MSRGAVVFVVVVVVVVGCAVALLAPGSARAAETDPYYAWLSPPNDGTTGLNAAINARLGHGLSAVNALPGSSSLSCARVARAMVVPLAPTALSYFASDMQTWNVDRVPRDREEHSSGAKRWSRGGEGLHQTSPTYRYASLLPFGKLMPLDPAVRVGDVLFGTDKLGHFFTNGLRYLDRFDDAVAAGSTVADAELAAVRLGIAQERGWLGMGVCGVFSYADLAANWRGLLFFRGLCASSSRPPSPSSPRLLQHDGRWVMSPAFDIAAVVDPCWDEAFATSAFSPAEDEPVRRAIVELCPRWRRPDITERQRRYLARGCQVRHRAILAPLVEAGEAPDPRPWSITEVCQTQPLLQK